MIKQAAPLLALCWLACESRAIHSVDLATPARPEDGGGPTVKDRAVETPADLSPADSDMGCTCAEGAAWHLHACVPTYNLGCNPTCDPEDEASCPPGWRCHPWAAASCCYCSEAMPACVLDSQGPGEILAAMAPLRVQPRSGQAGQEVELTIEGAPFYIGALWNPIWVNGEPINVTSNGPRECQTSGRFTPQQPGIYSVEVAEYGDDAGDTRVLAGFFVASGGVIEPERAQPGFPCSPQDPCAEAPPYSCSCVNGRCACAR